MLYYAALFFIVALVAAVFGFGGVASASVGIAQILFFVFIVLFVLTLIVRAVRGQELKITTHQEGEYDDKCT